LDGTLVDSSKGILSSLEAAFRSACVKPKQELEPTLIGPPLRETVRLLAGDLDPVIIDSIISTFKSHYDSEGFRRTQPYSGISDMLSSLHATGLDLHIATNKRARPTQLILSQLEWLKFFGLVYSPDSVDPPSANKAALLATLLKDANLSEKRCLYIGDRAEDWHSARTNGIRFSWARWGFSGESLDFDDNSFTLESPDPEYILSQF
jgi:phosphoglycolate phosphatase